MVQKFSIVMAFRNTPRERKFAEHSIPSAISLNPDEFVIGVDEPADESFLNVISDLCKSHSFENYKILQVPRSNEWNFQLANVIWHCYKKCKYDYILSFDVDSILRIAVMQGLELVGQDKTAVVSFTKKFLIKSLGDLVRYVSYRLRIMSSPHVFGGVYWIYRPYYYEHVNLTGVMPIRNGIDTYLINKVLTIGTHKVLTLKQIGVNCMDKENGDYPWRQFQDGIWCYANKEQFRSMQGDVRSFRNPKEKDLIGKILDCSPLFLVLFKTITYCYPWFLRGWLWARKNPEHDSILAARNVTREDWSLTGSQYVKGIRNWAHHGRLGTGFD